MVRISLTVLLTLAAASAAAEIPIATCTSPFAVPAGETARLYSDLSCGDLQMRPGSTLLLDGHVLSQGARGVGPNGGDGRASFTIRGPGEILCEAGNGEAGVQFSRGLLTIDGSGGEVVIRGCEWPIIAAPGNSARVVADHLTILRGAHAPYAAVYAGNVTATNVTIDLSGYLDGALSHGIVARKIRGSGIVVRHASNALSARRIDVRDVEVGFSHAAVTNFRKARITNLTSTTNRRGVYGRKAIIDDSTLATFDPATYYDVASTRPPRLANTSCLRSARYDPKRSPPASGTWGLCALD